MARFQRLSRPQAPLSQPIVNIRWYPLNVPAVWQEIGKYQQPPGNLVIDLYPGPQRRNGVGDITSTWHPMYNPNWTNQYPIMAPGTQRQVGGPPQQGPSRYGVYKLRRAVTQAQVEASGAAVIPFVNNSQNPLIAPSNG